jgi:hypothetical protein
MPDTTLPKPIGQADVTDYENSVTRSMSSGLFAGFGLRELAFNIRSTCEFRDITDNAVTMRGKQEAI